MNANEIIEIIDGAMGENAMAHAYHEGQINIMNVQIEFAHDADMMAELIDMDIHDFAAEWMIRDFIEYIAQRSDMDIFRFDIELQRDAIVNAYAAKWRAMNDEMMGE